MNTFSGSDAQLIKTTSEQCHFRKLFQIFITVTVIINTLVTLIEIGKYGLNEHIYSCTFVIPLCSKIFKYSFEGSIHRSSKMI